jgi:hypothetical protein
MKYLDGLLINNIIKYLQQVCLAVKAQYQVFFVVIVQNSRLFRIVKRMVYVCSGDTMFERSLRELDNGFHTYLHSLTKSRQSQAWRNAKSERNRQRGSEQ